MASDIDDCDGLFDDDKHSDVCPETRQDSDTGGLQEDGEQVGDISKDVNDKMKKLVKPKVIRKPQPKLDADRVTDMRLGISQLYNETKDLSFRGKGYEVEDLDRIMGKVEHWAHRLFPKMRFEEVIERCERLGHKKQVQTHIRKIRLDEFETIPDSDDNPDEIVIEDAPKNTEDIFATSTQIRETSNLDISPPTSPVHFPDVDVIPDSQRNTTDNVAISTLQEQQEIELSADVLADIEKNRLAALKRYEQFKARQGVLPEKRPKISENEAPRLSSLVDYEREMMEKENSSEQQTNSPEDVPIGKSENPAVNNEFIHLNSVSHEEDFLDELEKEDDTFIEITPMSG